VKKDGSGIILIGFVYDLMSGSQGWKILLERLLKSGNQVNVIALVLLLWPPKYLISRELFHSFAP
jgi:hypothetical protein